MSDPVSLSIIIPLVLIGYIHRRVSGCGIFFMAVSNIPATLLHEMAHGIFAKLFGAKVSGFSLWPKRDGNGWRLGSVDASVDFISAVPTAFAPLVWLVAAWLLLSVRGALAGGSLPILCMIYLVSYILVSAAIPSWQDIKVAASHPLSVVFWGVVLFAADIFVG